MKRPCWAEPKVGKEKDEVEPAAIDPVADDDDEEAPAKDADEIPAADDDAAAEEDAEEVEGPARRVPADDPETSSPVAPR